MEATTGRLRNKVRAGTVLAVLSGSLALFSLGVTLALLVSSLVGGPPKPCVSSIVFAQPYHNLDTAALCGPGRTPSEPLFTAGDAEHFRVVCTCSLEKP